MKKIANSAGLGDNMLLQAADDGSGSGSRKKEHIWHKVYKTWYGPYGTYSGYTECLLCDDPEHWGYVVGDIDDNGHGHVDFNGDGYADNGYCQCYDCTGKRDDVYYNPDKEDNSYGDGYYSYGGDYGYGSDSGYNDVPYYAYGDYGYGYDEEEEIITVRVSNVPNPGKVSNGHCELGIMAAQLGCSMDELWVLIDQKLAIWYPRTSVNTDYYPLPSDVVAGANYDQLSKGGQERWVHMQKAVIEVRGVTKYGEHYTDVIPGIMQSVLDEIKAMIGAPGTSNVPFNPNTNNNDVISAISSDKPYYTSLDRSNENTAFGHSVAIIGYTKGTITGKIYTYIIKDFVSGKESEISASSFE